MIGLSLQGVLNQRFPEILIFYARRGKSSGITRVPADIRIGIDFKYGKPTIPGHSEVNPGIIAAVHRFECRDGRFLEFRSERIIDFRRTDRRSAVIKKVVLKPLGFVAADAGQGFRHLGEVNLGNGQGFQSLILENGDIEFPAVNKLFDKRGRTIVLQDLFDLLGQTFFIANDGIRIDPQTRVFRIRLDDQRK